MAINIVKSVNIIKGKGAMIMKFVKSTNAQVFLFINAILYGSSYVWSKMLLQYIPRFSILFICAMGSLAVTLIMFFPIIRSITGKVFLISMAISGLSVLSNTSCLLALQYAGSSNTAFIVQMSVVITPVIMAVLERKKPEARLLICSLIALAGIFLLTGGTGGFMAGIGDIMALCNALFFSLFLACLKLFSNKVHPAHFTFAHHATNSVVFLILSLVLEAHEIDYGVFINPQFIVLAAASSLVVIITTLVQSTAINYVKAEKATIIYTFEPVAAALLAFVLLGEKPGGLMAGIGCLIILLAAILSTIKFRIREHCRKGRTKPLSESSNSFPDNSQADTLIA